MKCSKILNGAKAKPAEHHPKITSYINNNISIYKTYIENENNYAERFSTFYKKEGLQGVHKIIMTEYERFNASVEIGNIAKVKSKSVHKSLMRMESYAIMGCVEFLHEKDDSNSRNDKFCDIVGKFMDSYKPYKDRGKLKARCLCLTKAVEAMNVRLSSSSELEELPLSLKSFADNCIRAIVYLETNYRQDMEQYNSILNIKSEHSALECSKDSYEKTMAL